MEINDERSLTAWLSDKPAKWAQVIALRAALRVLPYIGVASDSWLERFALLPFHAVITSWIQLTESSIDIFESGSRANAKFGGHSFDFAAYKESQIAAMAADVSYHSADAQTQSIHVVGDCVEAVTKAAEAFRSVAERRADWGEDNHAAADKIWYNVQLDCLQLSNDTRSDKSGILAVRPLWHQHESDVFDDWTQLARRLRAIDLDYQVWIDWYQRRIRGERAAFEIMGDEDRVEDKKILRRLADASDRELWDRGYKYVNATLKNWFDEARDRVTKELPKPHQFEVDIKALIERSIERFGAPVYVKSELVSNPYLADKLKQKGAVFVEKSEEVPDGAPFISFAPPQESGATAYGVDAEGKLDRLPHSDQKRLRDTPAQRQAYADLRPMAMELRGEGQRLGKPLKRGLDRFVESFPKRFESAETYCVWRDANALRRLYWAHRRVEKSLDPDPIRLDPVIAEALGGMLDLYNNFAFGDDGLRAMDERRIPPQERANDVAEAAAAAPIIEAVQKAPEIATDHALDDIIADIIDDELDPNDPYDEQALNQANRVRRNWFAAAFDWAGKTIASPKAIGKAAAIGTVTGVAGVVGKMAMTTVVGYEFGPLLEFLATNATILQNYVAIAFSSYPHLPNLIEQVRALWNRIRA